MIYDANDYDNMTAEELHEEMMLIDSDREDDLGHADMLDDYDGQPDEYTEWQDYMGGDDWDHGQYEVDSDLYNEY